MVREKGRGALGEVRLQVHVVRVANAAVGGLPSGSCRVKVELDPYTNVENYV